VPYPEPAPTIDELIRHVPGLPDYTSSAAARSGSSAPITLENLLLLIQPWDGIRRNQYSNSHYVLLGAALQQANRLRFEDVVQRDIFGPAGMSRSSFLIPPASESVSIPPSTIDPSWAYAAGAATSTVGDVNLFNQGLLNNHFGFGAIDSFETSGTSSLGMWSARVNGDLRFSKDGAIDGYSSFTAIFPADKSSVVLLCNSENNDLYSLVMGRTSRQPGIREIMRGR
jgi:CubicO group peptidase (beta-lactamase class C family)